MTGRPETRTPGGNRANATDEKADPAIVADHATRVQLPRRGAWVTLQCGNGSRRVCRLAWVGAEWVAFDHGAYGRDRCDFYVRPEAITSAEPAARPRLMLTYRDPAGELCRVGRFETRAEAEAAIVRLLGLIHDVRIEEVQP